jgi:hypothetical protein
MPAPSQAFWPFRMGRRESWPSRSTQWHSAADGVFGEGTNGVHGRSSSQNDSGVWGENKGGGFGVSGSTNGGTGTRGTIAGVWGSNAGAGAGVRGDNTNDTGVLGEGFIGVKGTSAGKPGIVPSSGVFGENTGGGIGVWGISSGTDSVGVAGGGGYGGEFSGVQAPLRLVPANTAGHPTSGRHQTGEFYVDSTGVLFYCLSTGIPGTWKRVQLVRSVEVSVSGVAR